jgi:glycosyltransferase involved in cell wall biosynthesis
MQEADEIVVVDTGSTDNTVEKLKARGCRVEIKTWTPWRFDEPRNYAMSLASEDCNIFVSTDLDEVLEPGWADVLRAEWIDGKHTRAQYRYAWSHAENGEPARVFYYDKIHDKNWKWKYPVHELLVRNDKCGYNENETLDLFNRIYLHHYPDRTKSRGNYLDLLELRAQENPDDDSYGKLYLAHEYFYRRKYNECIDFIKNTLLPQLDNYARIERANIYTFLGDAYAAIGDKQNAFSAWVFAMAEDFTYREPYLRLAAAANSNKYYHLAVSLVQECFKKTYRHYSWLEQDNSWNAEPYDILSIAYYYLGEYEKAYANIQKALYLSSTNDTRLKQNLDYIQNKFLN